MNENQVTSGRLIDKHRREPAHCIYCTGFANSTEHVIPEAIGGRLTADILCATHNGLVNIADEPLNKNFAPLVTMLQIPRQRGGSGAEFPAKDAAGNPVTILAEGFAKQKPLIVHERDETGRIVRATGDLDRLDSVPSDAFSEKGSHQIIAVISNPEANFAVASDEKITGGVLKMALHFYAAFVSDITLRDANALLPYIIGEQVAGGKYVRTPFLAEDVFPESWPPRHEITAYPYGEHTMVTLLLFGAYAYSIRLPLKMTSAYGIRYRQVLSENFPQFFDDIQIPELLEWERPNDMDAEKWSAPIKARLERIHHEGAQQAVRVRCKRAYERGLALSSNFGDIWTRYEAALGLECFSADEIARIVKIGRQRASRQEMPWEVMVELGQRDADPAPFSEQRQ